MIEYLTQTGSTSADLAARLQAGSFVSEGTWLVADRQTAGKGRQGREWIDGAGNFMGSTVVRQRFGDPDPSSLALLTGLCVHDVLERHMFANVSAYLKWPNDIMIGAAKLAGILLERVADSVVVGIGVNLRAAPRLPDRETIALLEVGIALDRDNFAADLARQFAIELDRWRSFGLGFVIQRWLVAAHPIGTLLEVGGAGEAGFKGTFGGLTEDGALLLRLGDGNTQVIRAGEVRLAPSKP